MSQANHFLFINEVYFGATYDGNKPDKTRDYLNKDFGRVLYGLIQHDVLVHVFSHDSKKYAALANMRETFDHGLIVSLRKLLKPEREKGGGDKKIYYFTGEPGSCTGGDFIEDLYRLEKEHLDGIIADTREYDNDLAEFCFRNAQDAFSQLQIKVKKFKSSNYYGQLVKTNEGLGLHKNRKPIKREVVKQEIVHEPSCPFPINMTTYRPKFSLEVQKIAKCLNELSEIIYLYQSIMFSRGVSFFVPHDCYLRPYIVKCFTMFGDVDEFKQEINLTTQSIIKNLKPSLDIAHWSYR